MPSVWHKVVHSSVYNSLERLTETGGAEMYFKISILQGHACGDGTEQEIILVWFLDNPDRSIQ